MVVSVMRGSSNFQEKEIGMVCLQQDESVSCRCYPKLPIAAIQPIRIRWVADDRTGQPPT
jgi:hypothetical protein